MTLEIDESLKCQNRRRICDIFWLVAWIEFDSKFRTGPVSGSQGIFGFGLSMVRVCVNTVQ